MAEPPIRIAVILGTRPEAIKLAPVVLELRRRRVATALITTGQHRDLVEPILSDFGIAPDTDLGLMRHGAGLNELLGRAVRRIGQELEALKPSRLIVQGDTTSAMAATLAAFHLRIPVAHVEAGLRSGTLDLPFPEEMNRRVVSLLATWHFAPTQTAAENLRREPGSQNVIVTGNTVVDAVRYLETHLDDGPGVGVAEPYILATAHRRESWGAPIRRIALALRDLLQERHEVSLVFVTHPNPVARTPVEEVLGDEARAKILDAVDYLSFLRLLRGAVLAISDSGGVQEEGPTLGVPILVTRDVTERPEGVEAGAVRLVGTNRRSIREEALTVLTDESTREAMARAGREVYGDGRASQRIARVMTRR